MKYVRARSRIIPVSLIVAASFGFLLVVYLIIESGAADVAHAMLVIGWWLIPITLFHLVPFAFSALSWRELLPASTRPHVITVIWIRWIRESINSLLPVASIGGDIIVAIDGQSVTTGGDLRGWIENMKHPGDTATVTVLRNSSRVDIPVALTERPPQPAR